MATPALAGVDDISQCYVAEGQAIGAQLCASPGDLALAVRGRCIEFERRYYSEVKEDLGSVKAVDATKEAAELLLPVAVAAIADGQIKRGCP